MRGGWIFLAAVCTCQGQKQPDIRVDVNLVTVACSASRDGAPVKDLRREDFVLLDNKERREIRYFWREFDLPLTVGLVVDVSGSQLGLIRKHRETVLRFLDQVLGPKDRAFLVTVGRDVKLVTGLTRSIPELRSGVDSVGSSQKAGVQLGEPCKGRRNAQQKGRRRRLVPGCGGTALWNGVYSSARLVMQPVTGRKALIVLSDGLDTGSFHSLTDAIEAAQDAETLVYTIRYVSTAMKIAFAPVALGATLSHSLERLSNETGGVAYHAPRGGPFGIFSEIENDLRNLYVLGFTPPEAGRDGRFHKLEVKTVQPGTAVRARGGYTAQAGPAGM